MGLSVTVGWRELEHVGAAQLRPVPHRLLQSELGSPASANDYYANGTWNQHPASLDDQWAIFSTQEGLVPPGSGYLAPGGMIFVTASGQRRLLGHPYNTSTSYSTLSFVKGSSDGRYVLFTSDMNGSPRSDVFLAVVPSDSRQPAPLLMAAVAGPRARCG